jgi:hypothetical protein
MKTITHEGKEYILKDDVDSIVRERISKISESKRQAESRANLLESQITEMESRVKNSDALASQLATLQDELAMSNQRYERHSAIATHGITDPEIRDLIEWQYTKAMEGKAKKDKVTLANWLGDMKEGGDVPVVLRPYLNKTEASQPAQPAQPSQPSTPSVSAAIAQTIRPQTNNGVQHTTEHSTNGDILKRATDYEFFKANRAEIKKRYYAQKMKR